MSGAKLVITNVSKVHFETFVCTVQSTNIRITYRIVGLHGKNPDKEKCHNNYKYFPQQCCEKY